MGDAVQSVIQGENSDPILAVPDEGYHFLQWSDGSVENPRTETNVTEDILVTAEFAINSYTITYEPGVNGSIEGSTPQTVNHGDDGAPVLATPHEGHHFLQWSDGSVENPRTETNVTEDILVTAEFAINSYTITYEPGVNGSIEGSTPQTVNHGDDGAPVLAVPDEGHHFLQWSDGSTENPRTDTSVTEDILVTANFSINTYSLIYNADINGTLVGNTAQTVEYGANGSPVAAMANTGFHFEQWDDGVTSNPRRDNNVTSDISVTAAFSINTYTLTYLTDTGGSLSGLTEQLVEHGAAGSSVTAVPDIGYHFVKWNDQRTDNPRTDVDVVSNITVTARFEINTYTLSYLAAENGIIIGETTQEVRHGNNGESVEAVPDEGYHFLQWSDGSTDNPRTDINVPGDITVTALFEINQYTLTYLTQGNGSITGETIQLIDHGADGTAVTAEAAPGHHFVQWSDGVTTAVRIDTGVTADIGVAAVFSIDFSGTLLLPGDIPMEFVWIPAGTYLMGDEPTGSPADEAQHEVTIEYDFWMCKYEITQQQWLALMGGFPETTPSTVYGLGDAYPVYYVSWNDTQDFINALSAYINTTEQGIMDLRLPSESEWEYTCRAGTTTRFYFGNSDGCLTQCQDCEAGVLPGNRTDYMWYCGNEIPEGCKPVGGKLPNAFGLYDMSGNVYEWCEDDWQGGYNGTPTDGSAFMKSPRATRRVIRGGYWENSAKSCYSSARSSNTPATRDYALGFRLVLAQ